MRRGRSELFPTSMLFLALLACSGRDSRSSGPSNAAPTDIPAPVADTDAADSLALVAECHGATERTYHRLVAGARLTVDEKRAPATACAKLYRRKRCVDAWRALPTDSAPDEMSRVMAECAAAYCPSLADRSLSACGGLAPDVARRYLDFGELTQAIFELERGKAEAQRMAAHLLALSTPVLAIEAGWVMLDGAEVIRVDDLPKEVEDVPPLLEALRKRAASAASVTDIYLRAPEQAGIREINILVSNIKAAGYKHVMFCVARDGAAGSSDGCGPIPLTPPK